MSETQLKYLSAIVAVYTTFYVYILILLSLVLVFSEHFKYAIIVLLITGIFQIRNEKSRPIIVELISNQQTEEPESDRGYL